MCFQDWGQALLPWKEHEDIMCPENITSPVGIGNSATLQEFYMT